MAVVVQSIRRKPKELRWDSDLFSKIVGTPWAPTLGAARPEEADELPDAVHVLPERPEEPEAVPSSIVSKLEESAEGRKRFASGKENS